MPLRAKILGPQTIARRHYADVKPEIDSLPDDPADDVVFDAKFGLRTIQLNRPEKLNSLNGSMARKIVPRLQEWQKSDMTSVVVIKGAGRAFCAGGDVAVLAKQCRSGEAGQQAALDYFALEYKLDHLIATYKKPYVALLDGITMGGGVGLSVHAPFRIATEKTVFAMPETTIGFFPDVGASFFLSRMDGGLGTYLALTSERLKGPEVFFSGIATHYLHSSSLPDLQARLGELRFKDSESLRNRYQIINNTIEEFTTGIPHDMPSFMDPVVRNAIDWVFRREHSVLGILAALNQLFHLHEGQATEESEETIVPDSHLTDWAKRTLSTIRERSPTSVCVAHQQLQQGRHWNIFQTFQHEYHMASRFMSHPDFTEGIYARLIDKTSERPKWSPSNIEEVTREQVNEFFTRNPSGLQLLDSAVEAQYSEYPHNWLTLPQDSEVEKIVRTAPPKTKFEIISILEQQRGMKMGLKEKVEDTLLRRTSTNQKGKVIWESE